MYAISMTAKSRLSVTIDADLIAAGQAAVAAGEAESISAWVNDALRLKADNGTVGSAVLATLSPNTKRSMAR